MKRKSSQEIIRAGGRIPPVRSSKSPAIIKSPVRRKVLTLSDWHIPFHREDLIEKALNDHSDAHTVVLNGDIMDMYSASTFTKSKHIPLIKEYNIALGWVDRIRREFKNVVLTSGNHECLSEDTLCLTKEHGWLTWDKIKTGMHALTRAQDDTVEWQKIKKVHTYDYHGDMYETSGRCPMMISPNHRILHWHGTENRDNNLTSYTTASDLYNKGARTREYIPISGINKLPDMKDILDDEINIVGWILTDGYIRDTYYISQRESKVDKVTEILDRLGWAYSLTKRDRNITSICGKELKVKPERECVVRVSCKDKDAINRLDLLLNKSKDIPEWTSNLSERQFDLLLKSMIDGDGSIHKSSPTSLMLYIKDIKRVAKIQYLLAKNGYRSSTYPYLNDNWRINIVKRQFISIDCGYKAKTTKVPYNGTIWCITVDNSNFMVSRKGIPFFTGNSRWSKYFSKHVVKEVSSLVCTDVMARLANGEEYNDDCTVAKLRDFKNVSYVPDKWYGLVGKTLFVHPHAFISTPGGTVLKTHKYLMGSIDYDAVICGHTHAAGFFIFNGTLLIEQGCLCKPLGYQSNPDLIFGTFTNSYAVIMQRQDGTTDYGESRVIYCGLAPEKDR